MENTLQASELQTIRIENPKVNYVRQGAGAPVILAHGLAASLHDWDDLMPDLAASGYAAYALDLLGHGDSDKPKAPDEYRFDHVFDHYAAWIDSLRLNQPMSLIGHSLGGTLSLLYAIRFPMRIRAVVLVNPFYATAQLPFIMRLIFHRQLANTFLISRTPYRLFRLLVDLTSYNYSFIHREPHILPQRIRHQTAVDYQRASAGIYNIPRTIPSLTSELPRITQPTLLIWGNRDQTLVPASFLKLRDHLPNLKGAHALPICGHVPHQCHPDLFNPLVLEFLGMI